MEQVQLGRTGLKVSRICLGMMSYGDPGWRNWILSEEETVPFVRAAADAGVTYFDTADIYSDGVSEEVTGRVLRKVFSRRQDYVLATKVYMPMGQGPNDSGLSRVHLLDAVDASLQRLGVDYIDLYQIHRFDPHTPVEETMEALHDIVRSGKARYIGASTMRAWQFAKMQRAAALNGWTEFVSMQDHYNLLYREEERELLPLCLDSGVAVLPWSPLARGRLARAREEGDTTARGRTDVQFREDYEGAEFEIVEAVGRIAAARDVSRAQVALAWILSRPAVTAAVVGATRLVHLEDAVASTELELTDEEIVQLESPYKPRPTDVHR